MEITKDDIGKIFLNRIGNKVRIVEVDLSWKDKRIWPVKFEIDFFNTGKYEADHIDSCTLNGKAKSSIPDDVSAYDIIAEYKESK